MLRQHWVFYYFYLDICKIVRNFAENKNTTRMKTKKQVKELLKEYQEGLEEFEALGEETNDQYIFQGWVEALECVLDGDVPKLKIDPELQGAFDQIANDYAYSNYWHGTNGLFGFADKIEKSDVFLEEGDEGYDENSEDGYLNGIDPTEGWEADVHYGVQTECEDSTDTFGVQFTKANFELWKASNENLYARDVKLLKWKEM